jgi:invasion protein IalB
MITSQGRDQAGVGRIGRRTAMKRGFLTLSAALIALAAANGSASAANEVGTFKDWRVLVGETGDGKLCFAVSEPTDSQYSKSIRGRDPAFFNVTTAPAKGVKNEASTIAGYKFAANANVVVNVDGTDFPMFLSATAPDTAWAVHEQEATLIEAMKKGTKMTVTGTSSLNTVVTDTYSLLGITAALDEVAKQCP